MEQWKDIIGYEGLYQVSDKGSVKSLERTIVNKNGNLQKYPERLLKYDVSVMSNSSYYRVTLCKDHTTKRFLVHRLVATAFIPNPLHKEFVNHINNDGTDNSVSNIEWCTHSENMIHAQQQGRLFNAQSKGGTKAGAIAHQALLKTFASMVGSKYHAWTVLGTPFTKRGNKYYIQCQCDCGTLRYVESSRLRRGESGGCSGPCSSEYKI